jgi:hypothetical protein
LGVQSTEISQSLAIIAASLVTLTALLMILVADWRGSILLLAIQYSGVFVLVATSWPVPMAITKLVAGWIAGAVLGMAISNLPELRQEYQAVLFSTQGKPSARPGMQRIGGGAFYILTAIAVIALTGLAVFSHLGVPEQSGALALWLPGIQPPVAWGALALIGLGLLKLGFTSQPLHTTLGLLTALSGFEVIYASLDPSVLLAGLLAGLTLAIALIGAYLLLAPHMLEAE